MANYFCKYCGTKACSASSLTSAYCTRHPNGSGKGKHVVYEGAESSKYICEYCGTTASSISSLTSSYCSRHPNGSAKGSILRLKEESKAGIPANIVAQAQTPCHL